MVALPGVDRSRSPTVWTEAGVVTQRVADAAERAGYVFAVDPTSAEASLHRRQHRDERRRQEGRAVGHRARQPRVAGAWSRPRRSGSRSTRLDHNLGKIHDVDDGDASSCATSTPAARSSSAPSASTIPGARFRKEGLGKDVTDKFLAGLPGIQKEGCDGLITSRRAGSCTGCRRTCARCAWSSSATPRTRCRRSSRSRTSCSPRRKAGGAILAGLEHLDDRYLKAVGYATKSKRARGGLPKMVLVGDIVGDDADAVARATSEVVRIANARAGEGFVAVSAEARKKFWLDRKRTAAIASTPTPSRSTRTWSSRSTHGRVHRRHRAHQHRAEPAQQAGAASMRSRRSSRAATCRSARATTPARSRAPSCSRTACSRRSRCCARCARCGGAGSTGLGRAAPPERRAHATSSCCRTTRCARRGRRRSATPLQSIFAGAAFAPIARRVPAHPRARCCAAASGWRCTCTPATATCTPTSRSTATTTRCCRPRTRRWRASWRWRAAWTA